MMSSMVVLKSKQDVRLAEKVKTINFAQQQQNGIRLWGICHNLCFKPYIMNDPNITSHKIMCPDLIKCLKSSKMKQFPGVILL